VCVVCAGTGKKPCGQCGGTGTNQEDLFGGRFVKGDACWLCEARAVASRMRVQKRSPWLPRCADSRDNAGRCQHDVRLRGHDGQLLSAL
jgi:hypothetical protein